MSQLGKYTHIDDVKLMIKVDQINLIEEKNITQNSFCPHPNTHQHKCNFTSNRLVCYTCRTNAKSVFHISVFCK